jgi:hypothetical protein
MILGLAGLALASAACNRQPTYYGQGGAPMDPCDSSRNPLECRGYRDAGGNVNDYLQYGLMGMMTQRSYYNGQQQVIYVRDPGYHGSWQPSGHFQDAHYQQSHWQQNKIANQRAEINRLRVQRDAARQSSSGYARAQATTSATAPRPSPLGGNSRTVPSSPSPAYYHTSPPRPSSSRLSTTKR